MIRWSNGDQVTYGFVRGVGPPRDNGEAIALLGRHAVLDPAFAHASGDRLPKRARHEYVDDDVVLELAGASATSRRSPPEPPPPARVVTAESGVDVG